VKPKVKKIDEDLDKELFSEEFEYLRLIDDIPPNLDVDTHLIVRALIRAKLRINYLKASTIDQKAKTSKAEKRMLNKQLEANMKKEILDLVHSCSGAECTICEAKTGFRMYHGHKITLNFLGTQEFQFGRRWQQNYSNYFVIWSKEHGLQEFKLPPDMRRDFPTYLYFHHLSQSHNHKHYHIIINTVIGRFDGLEINTCDTAAIESLRRTFNVMINSHKCGQLERNDLNDILFPLRQLWHNCTDVGRAALKARAFLMDIVQIDPCMTLDYLVFNFLDKEIYSDQYITGTLQYTPIPIKVTVL
jgi:hypothetical protein